MSGVYRERSTLLVIDVQERLSAAMSPKVMKRLVRNLGVLAQAAARWSFPTIITEQYPQGLGKTMSEVEAAMPTGDQTHRYEKVEFSALQCAEFVAPAGVRDQWIVTGMETHVCVWQTVRDLIGRGDEVFVAADAVCSRTKENWETGLALMRAEGAVITSTETLLFDWLQRAGTEDFKVLSRLIR